jgi:pimeloyl-ACP methyl ester carboxylesterase
MDGVDVAVEAVGVGPPLVLLHGILCDSRVWRRQLDDLRHEFTVVAWDAPGCGGSADPPETWRLPEYADCLSALIAALDLVDPIVVGMSWGATLAITCQHRHPGVAAALVLVGAYAGWAGSLPPQVCAQRLASCLGQSEMRPADVAPEWIPQWLTSAAPAELVDELAAMVSDFHPSGFGPWPALLPRPTCARYSQRSRSLRSWSTATTTSAHRLPSSEQRSPGVSRTRSSPSSRRRATSATLNSRRPSTGRFGRSPPRTPDAA